MPKPVLSLRCDAVLIDAIDHAARRSGRSRSDEALSALAERFLGHAPEDAAPKAPKAPPTPRRAVAADPRQALAQAEARAGVRPARLDTSSVPYFGGGKRPAYQKGGGTKPKVRG